QGIEPQHLLLLMRHARHLACGSLHAPVSDGVLQTFLSHAEINCHLHQRDLVLRKIEVGFIKRRQRNSPLSLSN
ncbi:hypothetical protein, partial [Paracidovorax oryzae]|uniref:hypothetical protein n=1 Tax=Paracidovorax oryzae TaxID=862720 RepID=UPI0035D0F752